MLTPPSRVRLLRAAVAVASLATLAPATAAAAKPAPAVRPVVDGLTCRTACQAIDTGEPGSVVQVSGTGMSGVTRVVLLGGAGAADDRTVDALPASATAVLVRLPDGARTGPVRAISKAAGASGASRRRLRVGRRGAAPRKGPDLQARADVRRVVDGVAPSMSFFVRPRAAQDVAVDVLRDGRSVAHWNLLQVPGRSVRSVTWTPPAGGLAEGRYTWRVLPKAEAEAVLASSPEHTGGGAAAPGTAVSAASNTRGPSFVVVRHVFPIAGPHTYNLGAGRFGTGRAGHTHQGQDVFARCGTPLVAVTGGTIKQNAFEGNAGNYVVLAGDDGVDYAYMHLRERSPVKAGATVTGGQPLGRVGDTGDAVGCHLHFEIWPAPGWYTGGAPVDPLPALRSWDD